MKSKKDNTLVEKKNMYARKVLILLIGMARKIKIDIEQNNNGAIMLVVNESSLRKEIR